MDVGRISILPINALVPDIWGPLREDNDPILQVSLSCKTKTLKGQFDSNMHRNTNKCIIVTPSYTSCHGNQA